MQGVKTIAEEEGRGYLRLPTPSDVRVSFLQFNLQLYLDKIHTCVSIVYTSSIGNIPLSTVQNQARLSLSVFTMSQVVTETEANNPLVIKLHNGQVLHVESNEATDADEIPVIDVGGIYSEKLEDRQAVADTIREAAHRIGFFYVVNHVSISLPDLCNS